MKKYYVTFLDANKEFDAREINVFWDDYGDYLTVTIVKSKILQILHEEIEKKFKGQEPGKIEELKNLVSDITIISWSPMNVRF